VCERPTLSRESEKSPTGERTRDLVRAQKQIHTHDEELNQESIATLITFFKLLDQWEREAEGMQKSCSNCSAPAEYSIVAVVSTVGVAGRLQKTSPAVLFCNACLGDLADRLCSPPFANAVNTAYTTLADRLCKRVLPQIAANR
jgi:hypothetical protein